ncbi:MAG: serine/threonine protein kinase [Myxococcales bacterium]|nr:serine/threonine protein kinase [Myxococcales bacterium]
MTSSGDRGADRGATTALEVEGRLGLGGMAETFIARRRGPGGFEQRVCLKKILPHLARDPELLQLFEQEARLTAHLSHANVVQLLDFGSDEGQPFLVFELIEGTDLRILLRAFAAAGEAMTSGLVAFLAQELASALAYAHDAGLVHRDVSPSNVLLSLAGEVKLTDFGIAKAFGSPGLTQSGMVKGKVPYMAPEYARTGVADPRADLFSLGVTLYEALAGVRPYRGRSDIEVLESIARGVREPLSKHVPNAPSELVQIVERLIDPNPDARPPSGAALLDLLRGVQAPPTARRILGRHVREHRRASAPAEVAPPAPEAPYEATERIDSGGTMQLGVQRPAATSSPMLAAAHDVTRTRLPSADIVAAPVSAPEPVPESTATRTVYEPRAPSLDAADETADVPLRRPRARPWGLVVVLLLVCIVAVAVVIFRVAR